jgi:hypothetical protein
MTVRVILEEWLGGSKQLTYNDLYKAYDDLWNISSRRFEYLYDMDIVDISNNLTFRGLWLRFRLGEQLNKMFKENVNPEWSGEWKDDD